MVPRRAKEALPKADTTNGKTTRSSNVFLAAKMNRSLLTKGMRAMLTRTSLFAPASTAVYPAGISCNVPTATSSHVCDAFTDAGLNAAMKDLSALA